MGRIIIKASREDDLYAEWSSIVEAPTFIGTRAGLKEYLTDHFDPDGRRHTEEEAEERLTRADTLGSSCLDMKDGHWTDSGLIYEQRGWLPRGRFAAFFRSFPNPDGPPDLSLLEPFEDA